MPFLYFAFTCKDKILSNNFIKILNDSITGAVNFLERKHRSVLWKTHITHIFLDLFKIFCAYIYTCVSVHVSR